MPDLTGKLILVGEMSREVIWLFGRGLSIGCGLTWNVPEGWRDLGRAEKIKKIGEELRAEMNATNVCTQSIFRFLEFLDRRTRVDWRHLFLTTNWDFLLQREVFRSIPDSFRPAWLSNGHVFHLNGSVETLVDDPWRSPLLLPEDSYKQRTLSPEANKAYNKMIWGTIFVVVGVSFECETDRFLLHALNNVEDDLPIGESRWFIVNPDPEALATLCRRLQSALPYATFTPICRTLDEWRKEDFAELIPHGPFEFA